MFILKKLHIENFMSLSSVDIDFNEQQISAITGQNGQGKSAIIDAISFAITNHRKGESFKNYVKTGTEKLVVHLEALFKNKPIIYHLEVFNENTKGHALTPVSRVVTYDGKSYFNSEYSQFLTTYKLDKLEELMFLYQNSNNLVSCRPKERANLLKEIFGYEFPDCVKSLNDTLETERLSLNEQQVRIDEMNKQIFTLQPLMRSTPEEGIAVMEERVKEIDNDLMKIGEVNEDEIIKCDSSISQLQRTINSSKTSITSTKGNLSRAKDQLDDLNKYIKQTDVEFIKKEIDRLNTEIEAHTLDYQKKTETHNTLNKELSVLQFQLKEYNSQLEISRTGKCHACGQPIEESHVHKLENKVKDTEDKIEAKKKEISDLGFDSRDTKGKKLKDELKHNNDRLKDYEGWSKTKTDLENRIKDLKDIVEGMETSLTELESKMDILQKQRQQLADAERLVETKNSLTKEKNEVKQRIQTAREQNARNAERVLNNQKIEAQKLERDAKVRELMDKSNNLSLLVNRRKQEIDIFESRFPNYMVIQACTHLEQMINEMVQKVFPYCQVLLKPDKGGVNFVYTTESSSEEWISVSMASGAQRTVLGLAYFIALARLSNIDCIFLDEIDASCSPENCEIIYNFIAELDYFPQVFFISHRPEAHQVVKNKNENLVTYQVMQGTVFEES